ncbi:MAG: peptide chain release factor N(5)-glutamine methyltransferase [Lachnospiraceae bacterium]|nr:peptide chain release factor N(5)-glutamine methyltransferase [Lachnospiraceae bacterium]
MATIEDLLIFGREQLEESGNEYAKYERKVLLEEVLGCNYMYMLMNGNEEVPKQKEMKYKGWIKQRCSHYPLQYILGYAHFMDYTFLVNENVLIPRSDTEVLVEAADELLGKWETADAGMEALESRNEKKKVRVLDLCCGSGCIGISLKLYHEEIDLVLSDYSKKALEVTRKNLEKYNVTAEVLQGDLFESFTGRAKLIVSNPPYIESGEIKALMPEVREYEPVSALDGGTDGLDFYRRIIEQAFQYLEENGYLMFEIGYNQGEAVRNLMERNHFLDVQIKKDYAGLDRVVYGHL